MDIAGAISAVGASISLVKEIRGIDVDVDKAELKLKIADLATSLSDAKLALVEVREQVQAQEAQLADMRALLNQRETKTVEFNGKRYFLGVNGLPAGAPLCPVCERKGLFLQIAQDRSKGVSGACYQCPHCRANYGMNPGVMRA